MRSVNCDGFDEPASGAAPFKAPSAPVSVQKMRHPASIAVARSSGTHDLPVFWRWARRLRARRTRPAPLRVTYQPPNCERPVVKQRPASSMTTKNTVARNIQGGSPRMRRSLRCLFSCGRGSSVWQRQHSFLSSGFHVPQFGQSGIGGSFVTARGRPASRYPDRQVVRSASMAA